MPEATTRFAGAGLPSGCHDLPDPPEALFVHGRWPALPLVAIVGSRAATPYGRAFAHRLAADLARLGVGVVSGLARGIDAAAHAGALDADGVTIAMLPCSLDRIAPVSHADLARRIAVRGALVSEWEYAVPAHRGRFLQRNRLIAACTHATVVVEAAARSGALSTAAVARRLRRPVLAVPGDVDRATSRGCHALLRAGARVCEGVADVLATLDDACATAPAPAAPAAAGAADGHDAGHDHASPHVLAALGDVPRSLEELARATRSSPQGTLATLLELEWAGVVTVHPGPRWSRARERGA